MDKLILNWVLETHNFNTESAVAFLAEHASASISELEDFQIWCGDRKQVLTDQVSELEAQKEAKEQELADEIEALGELSKGKVSPEPVIEEVTEELVDEPK